MNPVPISHRADRDPEKDAPNAKDTHGYALDDWSDPSAAVAALTRDTDALGRHASTLKELLLKSTALDYVATGVSISDATSPHMPLLFVNRTFERMAGYAKAEVIGTNCRLLQGADREQEGLGKIRHALRDRREVTALVRNYKKDGGLFWNELSLSPLFDARGMLTHYVGIQADVTERVTLQLRLEYMAKHDPLTGLANRSNMMASLAEAIDAARLQGHQAAVLFFDLDGFKAINDGFGHAAGDLLLQTLSARMQSVTRGEDCVARLGGDEFVVVLSRVRDRTALHVLKQRLLDHLERPVLFEGASLLPRMSMGSALFPEEGDTPQQLLGTADRAMYVEKRMRAESREEDVPAFMAAVGPAPAAHS